MREFPATPTEMLASFWRNRRLILVLTKREVLGRYRGSLLGLLWSFFNPLFMLVVYTFVFSQIFKARWSAGSESKTEFALVLLAGLIMFNLFAECINRAPGLILSNVNYVKKVIFPLEILPIVDLLSAFYHSLVGFLVWLAAYSVFFGLPHPSTLYLPLILLPFGLFILGLSWSLASLGVFLRDVGQIIGVVVMSLMFLSPIFYPATALPADYQRLLFLNPLTPVVELARDVLYWGKAPDFALLGVYWLVAMAISWLGFAWFQSTRKGFADVL